MTQRNLNPYAFYERVAAEHRPEHAFRGRNRDDFAAWQKQVLPKVLETLGDPPRRVEPRPELIVEWEEDGLIKQRWVLDVQPHLSATMLIFRPAAMKQGERRPALLACHGHGPLGKDGPMGLSATPEARSNVDAHNYDYGLQMAKAGFVTYALDWLGFGERSAHRKPHYSAAIDVGGEARRDPCNVYYLCATMLGTTVLASNCHDGSRVTDFVCEQPYVDPDRLGVMGLSLGGTMTTWMALTDERFKAIDVMGYAGPWYDIAFRTYNVCGSQLTPGIHKLVDVADLEGLLAPRPLLVELGIFDSCFEIDYTRKNYERVREIYEAAGVGDKLELDMFPGEHAWGGNLSVPFFRKHLGE